MTSVCDLCGEAKPLTWYNGDKLCAECLELVKADERYEMQRYEEERYVRDAS